MLELHASKDPKDQRIVRIRMIVQSSLQETLEFYRTHRLSILQILEYRIMLALLRRLELKMIQLALLGKLEL
jgi:hypothetical protein